MGRPKPKVPRRGVGYKLPEDLLDQLDALAASTRRPVTTEVEIALEAHLEKAGLWPPPPKKAVKKAGE